MSKEVFSLENMGQRIAQRRKDLGWTQEKLAEKADLSPQFISYAESGKRAMRPENLLKISAALGVSTDFLLFNEVALKDGAYLAGKMQKLSIAQFKAIEGIIDECIALNQRMGEPRKTTREGKEKPAKNSAGKKQR